MEEQNAATSEIARNVNEAMRNNQSATEHLGVVVEGVRSGEGRAQGLLTNAQGLDSRAKDLSTRLHTFLEALKDL